MTTAIKPEHTNGDTPGIEPDTAPRTCPCENCGKVAIICTMGVTMQNPDHYLREYICACGWHKSAVALVLKQQSPEFMARWNAANPAA